MVTELILLFTIYSFVGWVVESTFCSVIAKKFVNRGFLNGPFCPVYGFGALLVVKLMHPFQDNLILLYLAGVVSTSLLEYFTGYLLETLFHTKWWDYSDHKFNIRGRVCLENALMFGVLAVVVMRLVHPPVMSLLNAMPGLLRGVLASSLAVYFIVDTTITARSILQLNGKLQDLQALLDEIKEKGGQRLRETVEETLGAERLEALLSKQAALENGLRKVHRRMLTAFPHMRSLKQNESLLRLKAALAERVAAARPSKNKRQ